MSADLPGLQAGRLYHYHLVADNASGSTSGEDRVFVAGSSPGSDAYRDDVLATPGLAAYWRIGELSGSSSSDETSAATGSFVGRYVLGQPGVLGPLGNTAASFDGASGELAMPGPALGTNATLEGWFRWRAGTAVLRDSTSAGGTGWILAFNSGGNLFYRLGGQGFSTGLPIGTVRDGEWHHIAATKQRRCGGPVRGRRGRPFVGHRGRVAARGGAVARDEEWDQRGLLRGRGRRGGALHAARCRPPRCAATSTSRAHSRPRPSPPSRPRRRPTRRSRAPGRAAACWVPPAGAQHPEARSLVRRGTLIARGAPGVRNNLIARRRGRAWIVRDRLAALRAGAGCRQVSARVVSCRAARVRRIVLFGGAGNDRLTVFGRVKVVFHGGPGRDVTRRTR